PVPRTRAVNMRSIVVDSSGHGKNVTATSKATRAAKSHLAQFWCRRAAAKISTGLSGRSISQTIATTSNKVIASSAEGLARYSATPTPSAPMIDAKDRYAKSSKRPIDRGLDVACVVELISDMIATPELNHQQLLLKAISGRRHDRPLLPGETSLCV